MIPSPSSRLAERDCALKQNIDKIIDLQREKKRKVVYFYRGKFTCIYEDAGQNAKCAE